jgi:hypothetical protein
MELDILSPMYAAPGSCHYYVSELCQLNDGRLVIPVRWVILQSVVHADAYTVTIDESVRICNLSSHCHH